jgi:hypothetical protein
MSSKTIEVTITISQTLVVPEKATEQEVVKFLSNYFDVQDTYVGTCSVDGKFKFDDMTVDSIVM